MKRIIVLMGLWLVATGCARSNESTANAPSPSPHSNAQPTASKPAESVSEDDIIAKEKQVWDAIKRKDFDGFGNNLAEDQVYVSNDGLHDKADTIRGVKDLTLTDLSLTNFKVMTIDKDAAIVTYTIKMKGTSGGQQIPAVTLYASTAWANRGGKWQAIFHQDTVPEQAR